MTLTLALALALALTPPAPPQIHESVCEDEVLNAFRQYADVPSYRFLRSSHCAFLDFPSSAAAADARDKLNGTRFGPQAIRVEWKVRA